MTFEGPFDCTRAEIDIVNNHSGLDGYVFYETANITRVNENGKVEVLEMFWKMETYMGVPPVLVYADLMSSGSDRNIETANLIFKNELQYLK